MSQHDMDVANDTFPNVRSDLNAALIALSSLQSGASAPSTTRAYMLWADTSNGLLKQRNGADSGWIVRGTLAEAFVVDRSSSTILGVADFYKAFRATASFTQTLTAAATLADGWFVDYRVESGATIVFDPNGSENIDGSTTKSVTGPASGRIYCNGSAFYTIGFPSVSAVSLHGKCRLTKSGTSLLLSPYDGNQLIINSSACTIPDAGVSYASAPGAGSTLYYVYAYMNTGTMTLEVSTTGYATQAGTGVKTKSGDATRTLVGMAYSTAGAAWADSTTQPYLLSYFNRKPKGATVAVGGDRTTTNGSYTEMSSSDRLTFITWADEAVTLSCIVTMNNAGANATIYFGVGLDGSTVTGGYGYMYNIGNAQCGSRSLSLSTTEGVHYTSNMAATSAGTLTEYGTNSAASVTVMG